MELILPIMLMLGGFGYAAYCAFRFASGLQKALMEVAEELDRLGRELENKQDKP